MTNPKHKFAVEVMYIDDNGIKYTAHFYKNNEKTLNELLRRIEKPGFQMCVDFHSYVKSYIVYIRGINGLEVVADKIVD